MSHRPGSPTTARGETLLWQQALTRRAALKRLGAGTLLALGLWPGALHARAKTGSRPFRFVVVNDTHYMSEACGAWLEGAVRLMRRERPEFCLLAGDLTEYGRRDDLAAVRDIFAGLGVPTFVQIGNHDYRAGSDGFVREPERRSLRAPRDARRAAPGRSRSLGAWSYSPGDRAAYMKLFPRRLNYAFEHGGWQFVGLDTTEGIFYQNTTIQSHTLRWVDDHLAKLDRAKPTVVFTHFPLGAKVRYRPINAEALLERFRNVNLRAVFSGHFHGFTERHAGAVTLTTNKCCALKRSNHDGTQERGFFVCVAEDNHIQRRFVECPLPAASPARRPDRGRSSRGASLPAR
ncbi:MAG: metallophosphoesterase [Verrucomicrobia bacterium]|nr:metallophosphoesterase [Verrucomicrobiota bacterium]